jgi:heme exporter protein A
VPAGSTGEPLLEVRSLGLARGGRELFRDLSFDVRGGQLWQVEGPNGAGKTSLLRILCGLSRYGFEGSVQRRAAPVYLGHRPAVKGLLSPRENLAWHVGGDGRYTDDDIEGALANVGLNGYEDVPSYTLSAGQHRRVNLARLYLAAASLWILDEPFTAIDREGVADLERLLAAHIANGGATVITSHQALRFESEIHRIQLGEGATS